jgi:hypothetical protein
VSVRAWKFLAAGSIGPFTGFRWPTDSRWVEERVHACGLEDLPYWLDSELWEMELDGPVLREHRQVVAPRGRLVARVAGWPQAQDAFALDCIERTRQRVEGALTAAGRTADAARVSAGRDLERLQQEGFAIAAEGVVVAGYLFDAVRRRPYPGLCSYIAATAAAELEGRVGQERERSLQSAWLRERLGL